LTAQQSGIPMRTITMTVVLVLIWAVFALLSDRFLSPRNLSNLAIELAITATLALGMLLVLLPGQIDLSAGSGVGLTGGLAAVLVFHHSWPAPVAIATSMIVGLVVWALMGALIVRQRVPAFIITLAGLLVFKGLFWTVISNSTVPVARGTTSNLFSMLTTVYLPNWAGYAIGAAVVASLVRTRLRERRQRRRHGLKVRPGDADFLELFVVSQALLLLVIVLNQFRGVPLSLLILGILAWTIQIVTRNTRFGRHLYAIGGNEEAAALSGVPVQRVVIGAFGAMGVIVGLTGILQTAYVGASTTTVGDLMELDAIAACVIGGTSLRGGRGSVPGVLFGALITASLLNGMTLLAVSPELKFIARGIVLVLAVWADVVLGGRE